jgi:hypothetical protein
MLRYDYHYFKDMEFSGVFDACFSPLMRDNIVGYKYFLFIKFRDLIYIDIKSVGSIIIPFEDLMKHKYLKMYYELSILLIKNKNHVIEKIAVDKYYNVERKKTFYKEERDWFINSAYFIQDFATKIKKVEYGKYYIYYNINPNDLRNMRVSNAIDIDKFFEVLWIRYGYEQVRGMNDMLINYTNMMLEYNINMIGDEIEEIAVSQEDNKNIINLIALNDKKGMNADVFCLLYKNVISIEGQKKFAKYAMFN